MSSLDRRKFLMLAGGGVVVAAGASAGVFAATRTPARALEPWERAGAPAYADPAHARPVLRHPRAQSAQSAAMDGRA